MSGIGFEAMCAILFILTYDGAFTSTGLLGLFFLAGNSLIGDDDQK